MAFAVPSAIPMIAPVFSPGLAGVAVGSVRRYFRVNTMPVMTVNPEMVGVVAGTSVTEGTV